jgi:hypothetical protein
MTALPLSITTVNDFSSGYVLPRLQQVRCHLGCVGRQLRRGRVRRIPFHVRGIFRAMCGAM